MSYGGILFMKAAPAAGEGGTCIIRREPYISHFNDLSRGISVAIKNSETFLREEDHNALYSAEGVAALRPSDGLPR